LCLHYVCCLQQLYDWRMRLCKSDKEMKYWKQLNEHCMTEESDDEEGAFRTHKPMWRSQSMYIIYNKYTILS